jgi:hypothetical protein
MHKVLKFYRVAAESADVARKIVKNGGWVLLEDADEAHDLYVDY